MSAISDRAARRAWRADFVTDGDINAAVSSAHRRTHLAWLDDDAQLRRVLFRDLPSDVVPLATAILGCDGACRLLSFLSRRPHTAMTASDLAYMVGEPDAELQPALATLVEQRSVDTQVIAGTRFYRLTEDIEALAQIQAFYHWRSEWLNRIGRLHRILQVA